MKKRENRQNFSHIERAQENSRHGEDSTQEKNKKQKNNDRRNKIINRKKQNEGKGRENIIFCNISEFNSKGKKFW